MKLFKIAPISMILACSALLSSAVVASEKKTDMNVSCHISSDFEPGMKGQAFVFKREDAKPRLVAIGGGRLFFDGQEAKLNATDKTHIADMERQMRKLAPEAQGIAVEAVDIAFAALIETAKSFAPSDKKLHGSLANARTESNKKMRDRYFFVNIQDENGKASFIDATIAPIIGEYISAVAGNVVSDALAAAFGGEAKAKEFEVRMKAMEIKLDKAVQQRGEALEPRVQQFCDDMQLLDATENKIGYRFPNGQAVELFKVSEH
jgi:Protein of unknown function (DUF2884)